MESKLCILLVILLFAAIACAKKSEEKPAWAKKDIRDYSDADMERLLDQWEVSDFVTSFSICLPQFRIIP